ncbi:Lysophospholipase 1 [Neolecta irregularis DAH-3]|uniref:Lysophospholipase n=1 Tax=Neolecta irregularis (strain DAH-3) TaxID=1198029 RepID=A0A1U7LPT9_NEOID|nr:Lysophospholipase 1 [Neolecta irregularis DAH-3]|eukprot:OLL24675.1 Lysophospholipase 1 [Neolecta irregularis DAH-3]
MNIFPSRILFVSWFLFVVSNNTSLVPGPSLYRPVNTSCPSYPLVRTASKSLSSNETSYVNGRDKITNPLLSDLLTRLNLSDFDVSKFLSNYTPKVALSFSGGGYRAMLNGAGTYMAMDSRTDGSEQPGHLGGLLQAATYLTGLSGGSWLIGSLVVNNFTTVQRLQSTIWDFRNSIFAPFGSSNVAENVKYYEDILQAVQAKSKAGFEVTLTDFWGRALSRQLIDDPNEGLAVSFSSILNMEAFMTKNMPFPIIVADGRAPNEVTISVNTTVFDINPYEFGSWSPDLFAFTSTTYLGTNLTGGMPTTSNHCVTGFDNAAFIMGTSSSLFNEFLLRINSSGSTSPTLETLGSILSALSTEEDDIAAYPNSFYNYSSMRKGNLSRILTLVDGGEDLENIPLDPVVQPARAVDVVFAIDSSADVNTWPNGTALVASYERSLNKIANGTTFPSIPDQQTIVNLGLNSRPTFFGCNATNFTSHVSPLIVYVPNHPMTFYSNITTFTFKYDNATRDNVIGNGYNVFTQGNSTEWASCVACAIIHREVERQGQVVTNQCQSCLNKYCWNGTLKSSTNTTFAPSIVFPNKQAVSAGSGGPNRTQTAIFMCFIALIASVLVLL